MTLKLRGITKTYGSLRANDGVDLDVAGGELHGLLGENGAGKSTLMKVLSGFVRADAGEVELDGRVLSMASPRGRSVVPTAASGKRHTWWTSHPQRSSHAR